MGYHALASHLRNWELRLLTQRIETQPRAIPCTEELPPETFYMNYREHACDRRPRAQHNDRTCAARHIARPQ